MEQRDRLLHCPDPRVQGQAGAVPGRETRSSRPPHRDRQDSEHRGLELLGVVLSCYRDFDARVNIVEDAGARSTSYDIVRRYVLGKVGAFTKREALEACPSLGSSSVESALKKLADNGTLKRIGAGRKTQYVRSDSLER